MNKIQYCSEFIIFSELVKMYILSKLKINLILCHSMKAK